MGQGCSNKRLESSMLHNKTDCNFRAARGIEMSFLRYDFGVHESFLSQYESSCQYFQFKRYYITKQLLKLSRISGTLNFLGASGKAIKLLSCSVFVYLCSIDVVSYNFDILLEYKYFGVKTFHSMMYHYKKVKKIFLWCKCYQES